MLCYGQRETCDDLYFRVFGKAKQMINLSANWANDVLQCPNCGSDNLHHDKITVFDREEDDEETKVTTVNCFGLTDVCFRPSLGSKNPSSRRHGLTIEFWCECCYVRPVLTLAQHKGVTLIEWKD